jgi:predicted aspartyl protease
MQSALIVLLASSQAGGLEPVAVVLPESVHRVQQVWEDPVSRSRGLLAQDRWAEALVLLEGAIEGQLQRVDLVALLGRAAWRAGQLQRAVELFEVCLRRQPDHASALAGIVRNYWIRGDRSALAASERAVEAASESAECWALRAAVLARWREFEPASEALRRARELGGEELPRRAPEALLTQEALTGMRASLRAAASQEASAAMLPLSLPGGVPVVLASARTVGGEWLQIPVLIDTGGSSAVGLDESLQPSLAFRRTGVSTVTGIVGSSQTAVSGVLDELRLGPWEFQEIPVLWYSLTAGRGGGRILPYLGIVGPVVIREQVLSLNFHSNKVSLRSSLERDRALPENPHSRALRIPLLVCADGKTLIRLKVNGDWALALLDTGAARSAVSRRAASDAATGVGAGGRLQVPQVEVRLLGQSWQFEDVDVRSALDTQVSKMLGMEVTLLLGMDFLRRYGRVVVDLHHHLMTLTSPTE